MKFVKKDQECWRLRVIHKGFDKFVRSWLDLGGIPIGKILDGYRSSVSQLGRAYLYTHTPLGSSRYSTRSAFRNVPETNRGLLGSVWEATVLPTEPESLMR